MHGVHGNSLDHTGYGCQMPAMVQLWRESWSTTSGTDPLATFGLVALPGSGSEGGTSMGAFRWAQTGNFGYLPNTLMPNTFLAQAYDLNDPWGDKTCYGLGCCSTNKTGCEAQLIKRKLPATGCDEYCTILRGTQVYMGGIHPRDKRPVGVRLADAIYGKFYGGKTQIVNGPTLAGCTSDASAKTITLSVNAALLGDEAVAIHSINTTLTPMEVLTNITFFCLEPMLRCKLFPNGTRPIHCGSSAQEWYCPSPSDALTAHKSNHKLTGTPPRNPYDSTWIKVPVMLGKQANTITVDTSAVNVSASPIVAIRYAWNGADGCCIGNGINIPCTIEQCPITTNPSGLPANPFIALVKESKCQCLPPQKCDA